MNRLRALLCLLCASQAAADCMRDGIWPQTPAGKQVDRFCNPLNKSLLFTEFESILGSDIPSVLRDAVQNEFDSILQWRACNNDGTWGSVMGTCPSPAGCWLSDITDLHCQQGYELSGWLCYPPCKTGYDGVGPVCWQQCPPNSYDAGTFCAAKGSPVEKATIHDCPWFDPCGLLHNCTTCPFAYDNYGCICKKTDYVQAKDSYGRGAGVVPSLQACPSGKTSCGILCTNDENTCKNLAVVIVNDVVNAIFRDPLSRWVLGLGPKPIVSTLDMLLQLILTPQCGNPTLAPAQTSAHTSFATSLSVSFFTFAVLLLPLVL